MRTAVLVFGALLASGCTTTITQEMAQQMPTLQLCEDVVRGRINPPQFYLNEVARRGDSCDRYMGIIQARQQQRQMESDALFRASQQLLQQSQQPMPSMFPPSRQVNCQSWRTAAGIQTRCD